MQGKHSILQAPRSKPFFPDGFAPERFPMKQRFRHEVPIHMVLETSRHQSPEVGVLARGAASRRKHFGTPQAARHRANQNMLAQSLAHLGEGLAADYNRGTWRIEQR